MMAKRSNVGGRDYPSELHKKQRAKNFALSAALLAFVVVVYFVAIVRMGGG